MRLLDDIHAIAVALKEIAAHYRPVEPVPPLPAEEAVSYYSEPKEALLEEIDRAKAAGQLSDEAEAELLEALEKEPL